MNTPPESGPEPEELDPELARQELLSDLRRGPSRSSTPSWTRLLLYGAGSLTVFLTGLVVGGMIPRSTVEILVLVGLFGLVLPLFFGALYGMSR